MVAIQNANFLIVLPEYKIETVIGEYRFQIQMPVLLKRHWVQAKKERDMQRLK